MKPLATLQQPGFVLTVLNGSEKGVSFQLVSGRVTIGRADDNVIMIKDDPKISRNHAVISLSANGAEISDVSDKNKVLVGEEEVTTRRLKPGDIIQLGGTKFQFKVFSNPSEIDLISRSAESSNKVSRPRKVESYQNRSKSKLNFYIVVGAIIILFAWLLSSNVGQKGKVELRTDDDVQTELNTNQKLIEEINAEKNKSGENTPQYQEAQPNFIKGFRDYRKGQYERAIESFQACLSLFSAHPQCQRYLRLSEKKFSELLQYQMILANKYRSQSQYSACKTAYRNVMVMIKNSDDKIYREAKSGFSVCNALEGERF